MCLTHNYVDSMLTSLNEPELMQVPVLLPVFMFVVISTARLLIPMNG